MLSNPFILMQVFFKIGPEIRKLVQIYSKWLSWMPPYLRLCDVTQPKLNMQNQCIKGFQEYFFAIDFIDV